MTRRYSNRAKTRTTNELRVHLSFLKENRRGKVSELKRIRRYKKYYFTTSNIRRYNASVKFHIKGIIKINKDIAAQMKLIDKYYKEGKIYKINTKKQKNKKR